jgi:hypothetical protein
MKKHLMSLGVLAALALVVVAGAVAATTVVVTPAYTQGWSTADTRPGGAVNYVADASAPGGSALQLTTDTTTAAKGAVPTPPARERDRNHRPPREDGGHDKQALERGESHVLARRSWCPSLSVQIAPSTDARCRDGRRREAVNRRQQFQS